MTSNTLSRRTSRIRTVLLALTLILPTWTVSLAQLPPEVEADRMLLGARDAMEAKQWGKARHALDAILKLGISVPAEFHYHRARANDNSPREAREALTVFLKSADRNSATYRDALVLFNTVDGEINRVEAARKAAADAAAAKERAEREAYAAVSESEREALRKKKPTFEAAGSRRCRCSVRIGARGISTAGMARGRISAKPDIGTRAAHKNHAENAEHAGHDVFCWPGRAEKHATRPRIPPEGGAEWQCRGASDVGECALWGYGESAAVF